MPRSHDQPNIGVVCVGGQKKKGVKCRDGNNVNTHLKKLRRAEGGEKMFGVFRVKNHDFTPKNHIFFNCGGRRERNPGSVPGIFPHN
jgi:hypothetical protein